MHFLRCLLFLFSLINSASSCLVVINVLTSTRPPTTEKPCCSKVPKLASQEFINETFIQTVPNAVFADSMELEELSCDFRITCSLIEQHETDIYEFFLITQSSSDPAVTNVVLIKGVRVECPFGSDTVHVNGDKIIGIGCYMIRMP
ncbi:unnamed protein product [Caenorhabditis brenneri]